MKMTKLLSMLLAIFMVLSAFVACNSDNSGSNDDDSKVEDKDDKEDKKKSTGTVADTTSDDDVFEEDPVEPEDTEAVEDTEDVEDTEEIEDTEETEDNRPSGDESEIEGTWYLDIGFGELAFIGGGAEAAAIIEAINTDATLSMSFEFDSNGKATARFDMESFKGAMEEFVDDYISYLKNGGFESLMGMSKEDFEALIAEEGMTMDDFYASMKSEMAESMGDSLGDMNTENTADYTYDGKIITIDNGEMEVEVNGNKMNVISVDIENATDSANVAIAVLEGKTLTRK